MPKQRKRLRLKQKIKNRTRKRKIMLRGLALIGIVIIGIVMHVMFYKHVHQVDDNVICDHVYIGEVDVSGMTKEQAKEAVLEQVKKYEQYKLTMKVNDNQAQALLGEMGFAVQDIDQLVKEAAAYGKTGSTWKRYRAMQKLEKEKHVIDESFCVDEELSKNMIQERAVPLEHRAVDATISRSGSGFRITDEEEGKRINIDASLSKITTYLNDEWKYEDASVELVQEKDEPRICRIDLETIQDELGSYYTDAGVGERVQNLRRATELISGTVLMPGEEFSVEAATIPYTEENGYVSGSAYENGQVVKNIGGGICQVSTTLYNAVLYAELEITERSAHSMIVNYVEPSRDAAIAQGLKDLKFKNTYETPIMIDGYIDGNNQLWFYIYGKDTRLQGRKVEFESETLETTSYTVKYVEDADSPIGTMEEEGSRFQGSKARLWKIVTENGKEVSRDVINNSTYRASEVTVKVGSAAGNAEAVTLVRNAIRTQDKAKIDQAIAQARNM